MLLALINAELTGQTCYGHIFSNKYPTKSFLT
jgi:hypothetical protein